MRYGLTALLLSAAPVLQAQESAVPALGNAPELLSAGYLMQVVGSLAIVFGAVVLMAVVVKRVNRSPSTGKASLSVMGSTNVGTREKVVLINAAGQQILVGVAPGNVRTLHVFEESLATDLADDVKPADFNTVWQSVNPFGSTR
jgi:flagellar protein FliO/FliZ